MKPVPPLLGYHLVAGPKGNRWCYAAGHQAAKAVYRGILPRLPRGTELRVLATLHELGENDRYWVRSPRSASEVHGFHSWGEEQKRCS